MLLLLLSNFVLMAFDARQANTQQRVIRVWAQTTADFVQSPVTSLSSGISNYFQSISRSLENNAVVDASFAFEQFCIDGV